jgi:acetate kinase
LSFEYIASELPKHEPKAIDGRAIVAHLGNGASLCAMTACKSIASTMGFSALDGLPMGTRCGAIDPGVILYLQKEKGMNAEDIETMLYQQSGLLGVSGISSDVRQLLACSDMRAREAIDLFVYRCAREIGSLAAAAQGLDALVFTASGSIHRRFAPAFANKPRGLEFAWTRNATRPADRESALPTVPYRFG